jgi:hypothetical protein
VFIRVAHRWRTERPSKAVIGGRPYPIAGAHRQATGPIGGWWWPIRGNLWGASGLLLAAATAAHAGRSSASRSAPIGAVLGAGVGRSSAALIAGGRHHRTRSSGGGGWPSGHSERGEEIDPGDEVTDGQTSHFLQKDFE